MPTPLGVAVQAASVGPTWMPTPLDVDIHAEASTLGDPIWMPTSSGVEIVATTVGPIWMPTALAAETAATVETPSSWTPASVSNTMYLWADANDPTTITHSSNRVSQWRDKSGNASHFAQATGSAQPLYEPTAGPNGTGRMRSDDVLRWMNSTWNPPAPGTQPVTIWAVFTIMSSPGAGTNIWGGHATGYINFVTLAGTGCRLANGVNGPTNGNLTVGTPTRAKAYYSNTINDSLRLRNTAATAGTALGNNDATSFNIMSRNSGSGPCPIAFHEIIAWAGALSAPDETALEAYGATKYGTGPFS
jgi:hypothetical protein